MAEEYTSGAFARRAHVTLRTIRYYDQKNLLKPSRVTEGGARRYTDADLAKLQQILLLKYLGFSLEDIREMTVASRDRSLLMDSLRMQKRMLRERIGEMESMIDAIGETEEALRNRQEINWNSMLELIHLTAMERSLKTQYLNAQNIEARIALHRDYSENPESWFHWILEQAQLRPGMRILEIGCGNGALWTENREALPEDISVVLSDISEGMVRETERQLTDPRFSFTVFDCAEIPFAAQHFDLVIANHLLFYVSDIGRVLREVKRVLVPGGTFLAATYGSRHMQEITSLVQEFDPGIVLSAERLYENFGLENGAALLQPYFLAVCCRRYTDSIYLEKPEPLIAYILSCHGNQNSVLLNHYKEFRDFVARKVQRGFRITKDAGCFVCRG